MIRLIHFHGLLLDFVLAVTVAALRLQRHRVGGSDRRNGVAFGGHGGGGDAAPLAAVLLGPVLLFGDGGGRD